MKYTCSCCGYRTLEEEPGTYEICSICYWENDEVQFNDPDFEGGANEAVIDILRWIDPGENPVIIQTPENELMNY